MKTGQLKVTPEYHSSGNFCMKVEVDGRVTKLFMTPTEFYDFIYSGECLLSKAYPDGVEFGGKMRFLGWLALGLILLLLVL